MKVQAVMNVDSVIDFIETHLDGKLSLEAVANAVNYSKYHMHRMFTNTVGMTIHDYVLRRQLTEAAKLLVFSEKPIIEIAFLCGYESQQAFTVAFKSMYKLPPAEYRQQQEFYPLQLRFELNRRPATMNFKESDIQFAQASDIPSWMKLVHLVIDGYPHLDEAKYQNELSACIADKRALILKDNDTAVGIMAFSYDKASIQFLGVHPQYRSCNIPRVFLNKLMQDILPGREISFTTYRARDRADTGHRKEMLSLGFAERELLVEFGYPTQRFVFSPKIKEDLLNDPYQAKQLEK